MQSESWDGDTYYPTGEPYLKRHQAELEAEKVRAAAVKAKLIKRKEREVREAAEQSELEANPLFGMF